MSTSQLIGGYTYRYQIARTRCADHTARQYIGRLLDEHPGPALAATYIARIGLALGEISEAVDELERIGREARNQRRRLSVDL